MLSIFKIIIVSSLIVFLSGCSQKISIKSLHPSKITEKNIHVIHIRKFENDRIHQTELIEEELSSSIINQKKVFKLKNNILGVDAIIEGKVLESSLEYDVYYKREDNRFKCKSYVYHEKSKTCVEYYERIIPCERREYKVVTKINVHEPRNGTILFAKTYERNKNTDQCFEQFYFHNNFHRNKKEINTKLARQIAYDLLKDISPHYKYYNIEVIDKIEEIEISEKQEEVFSSILDLIDDKNYELAKERLEQLNIQTNSSSWEILYNLGLLSEKFNELEKAKNYYEKAKTITLKDVNYQIINNSLNRVNINLREKIKAISQLP